MGSGRPEPVEGRARAGARSQPPPVSELETYFDMIVSDRLRPLTAEFVGTALLLAAVVGSGIMGEQLAGGNAAVALLANTLATGAALVALILTFGPISGAHFNPAVSFA